MKKYILATLILFIPCVTYALTMCARDNSLVIVLNRNNVGNATSSTSRDENMWRVNFTYGTIIGEATCLSESEKENVSFTDYPKGLHGVNSASEQRLYCYCRMTHPALSDWVYITNYYDSESCHSQCTAFCGQTATGHRLNLNTKLFNAIGR